MSEIGIWEKNEGIYRYLLKGLPDQIQKEHRFYPAAHPGALAEKNLDLLVISPGVVGWAGAGALTLRRVLLPGAAAPLVRTVQADSAVSYGTGPRNSITISSMEGRRLCVAVQRELVTVTGGVVERQELVLTLPERMQPMPYLAAVGALLLLDVSPEEMGQTGEGKA